MSGNIFAAMFLRAGAPRLRIPLPKTISPQTTQTSQVIALRQYKTTAPLLERVSGFTVAGLKKNWSAVPMVVICGAVVIIVPVVGIAIAKTRPDVCFHKNWGPLSDRIDLENAPYLKAFELEEKSHNLPEVAELYRDMNNTTKQ